MLQWADDLKIAGIELFLDSRTPRETCFVSHAHSDHICVHHRPIATAATAELARYRIGMCDVTRLATREPHELLDPATGRKIARIELRSAGHILGSAMIHVTTDDGTLLYTGDFKMRASRTAEPADPIEADYLVMESTYGLPMFRFPAADAVAEQLVELCTRALRDGRQPIVTGYSLGKSQEITRILTDAGLIVTQHGAPFEMTRIYEECGTHVGPVRRYAYPDFHGPAALPLEERGVLVAPPSVARSGFVTRFENPVRIMCTGWALISGAIFRYGVDHALPLSDHADFDELLELIDRVKPKKIFTHHGYPQFVDHLQQRGLDATLARPDPQLSLF